MITTFWLLATLLAALAAAFILLPMYLRPRTDVVSGRTNINVDLYGERLGELQSALDAGELSEPQFQDLKAELQKSLLQDTTTQEQQPALSIGGGRLPVILAIVVPAFALFAYAEFGLSWGAIGDLELAQELKQSGTTPHEMASVEQSVDRLARRLESQPENDEGWFLLAQSYMNLGQYGRAADAFDRLASRYPNDADLAGYKAEAMFLAAERRITPDVAASIAKTEALDPGNLSMLEIRAMDAFSRGDGATAINFFKKALRSGAEGERATSIESAIASIEDVMRERGIPVPVDLPTDTATNTAAADQGDRSITVEVALGSGVQAAADAALFVFARAVTGPPMPLAVQRLTTSALPATVKLDESMAMMAGMGIANFDSVVVVARISSTGIANASPADYEAVSAAINLAESPASQLKLTIEKRRSEQ